MLTSCDLLPENFNWKDYSIKNNLDKILQIEDLCSLEKINKLKNFDNTINPKNKVPFPPELDDLARLHFISVNRKATTILEFGVGKSSQIFGDSLKINKLKWLEFSEKKLRRESLYQCHSVDNNSNWIEECRKNTPIEFIKEKLLTFHEAKLITSEFLGRVCTYFDPIPNISPDLIYLDAPDQFSAIGDIRGISTKHKDRMPMSGDILNFEHFLQPGTLIIVDGRTANARFIKSNLQRNWAYFYSSEWDQHFFELQEKPLGIFNEMHINHCLGESYFLRSEFNED